ncbi:MAG: hypothetical protein QXP81_10350 [Nitrososphaerota archaeon]
MGARARLKTCVGLDWGSLAHVAFGVAAVLLGFEWLATLIFLAKQLVDLYGGEEACEASGDIAEYALGLTVGFILRLLPG